MSEENIRRLAENLKGSGRLKPNPEFSSVVGVELGGSKVGFPEDFCVLIELCGGHSLEWGLEFTFVSQLPSENINRRFRSSEYDFSFPEFESAYLFAWTTAGDCIGIDLREKYHGWIFSYIIADRLMVSHEANYLFRSIEEFLVHVSNKRAGLVKAICPVVTSEIQDKR